jgi:hypothetical protein
MFESEFQDLAANPAIQTPFLVLQRVKVAPWLSQQA